jgi:hypothetical protein
VRKIPHVTETLTDVRPAFTYEACPYNPLRILVRNSEGELLESRAITVIVGERSSLLRLLRDQELQRRGARGLGK